MTSASPISISWGLSSTPNLTGTVRTVVVLTGFNLTLSSTGYVFDIAAVGYWLASTPTVLYIDITSTSSAPMYIHGINFQVIFWNEYNVGQWPFPAARINYEEVVSFDGSGVNSVTGSDVFFSYNTLSLSNSKFKYR